MSPRGKMVFPRVAPEGKPSSRGETFHQDTHTGMAYLYIIIPQVKILSRDWLTKVGHSIMSTGEMSTGKMSTLLTGDA